MQPAWPATDVIRNIEVARDRAFATARTDLYLQGNRDHIHTTTILIAADRVLSELLHEGERLPDVHELQNRNLSNRNLTLTVADSRSRISQAKSAALRGSFRTNLGRTLYVNAAVTDEVVQRRHAPAGIFGELLGRMHIEASESGVHTTRLDPLGPAWTACPNPTLGRHAIIEFVLEGTRQPIREQFGNLDGYALVVAGWRNFALPRWQDVVGGCVLEYRLSEGRLPSGARLVHCDFAFAPSARAGRLTIASVPASRMSALKPNGVGSPAARANLGRTLHTST